MEIFRHVAQGRLSEVAGPLANDIDQSIRVLDLDRSVAETKAGLPEETRVWLERYVAGVNAGRERLEETPADLRAIGVEPAEWTVEDTLTVGRLAAADINWGYWFQVLRLREEDSYPAFRQRLDEFEEEGRSSFGPGTPTVLDPLLSMARTGSNSFVVSSARSASGGALIASDPHLGLPQPNLFFVVGYRAPGTAVVGLTIPGLPMVLEGRSEHVAWGATNMQALSSSVFDLSGRDNGSYETRDEIIRTRLWFDKTVTIRESPWGPLLNDAPLFPADDDQPLALTWRGHRPSDEATAFLKASRARNWEEFRAAFETYAVSGQNMLYADKDGNIGQLLAFEFDPAAGRALEEGPFADPDEPSHRWGNPIPSTRLPASFNPEQGFLISCNNTPVLTDPPMTRNGNANDRFVRLADLLSENGSMTLEKLMAAQLDVYSEASLNAARAIVEHAPDDAVQTRLLAELRTWDGVYDHESTGAVAYQIVLSELINESYRDRYGDRIAGFLRSSKATHDFVRQDVESGEISPRRIERALRKATNDWRPGMTWGDVHRIRLAHPIGNIPLLGGSWVFDEFPADGSTTTVHKTAHRVTDGEHRATFGSNARHVSDMSDPDENYFVILGGQDGWIGSEHMLDQVPLWREGRYMRIPLRESSVREAFPVRTVIGAGE